MAEKRVTEFTVSSFNAGVFRLLDDLVPRFPREDVTIAKQRAQLKVVDAEKDLELRAIPMKEFWAAVEPHVASIAAWDDAKISTDVLPALSGLIPEVPIAKYWTNPKLPLGTREVIKMHLQSLTHIASAKKGLTAPAALDIASVAQGLGIDASVGADNQMSLDLGSLSERFKDPNEMLKLLSSAESMLAAAKQTTKIEVSKKALAEAPQVGLTPAKAKKELARMRLSAKHAAKQQQQQQSAAAASTTKQKKE